MKSIYTDKQKEYFRDYFQKNKHDPEFIKKHRQNVINWRIKYPERYLLQKARARALVCGVEFNLKEEDIKIPDKCPALKTEFVYNTPYTMSVDKINPKLGYTKDNIQVLSRKANAMKQDASKEELINFANWILND